MSWIDWLVLITTLLTIVIYGSWKTRKSRDLKAFLKGNNSQGWATIGLSIMATQASAITFLSTPGQAYEEGMGFVQFYFGLPIAMIIISVFILPIYYRLKVFTAYQYLEDRFDTKVRALTAFLFLVSRGLAAGITIYAPAIILTTLLGWNLQLTCVLIGLLVIVYTVSGGTKAVSLTQKWQMSIIMIGMFIACYYILQSIPGVVSFGESLNIAGSMGKMEVISTSLDPRKKYTLLSGFTGGVFLFLSYFGTDQSQVQRYLGGKSLKESRLGLMFNGLVKIPMQFFILFIGALLFISFQFNKPPIVFNEVSIGQWTQSNSKLQTIKKEYDRLHKVKEQELLVYAENGSTEALNLAVTHQEQIDSVRNDYKKTVSTLDENYEQRDSDYIFLTFVLNFLPKGLIGLLLAVILSAAMSSTAGELNALASTTTIDYYKKFWSKQDDDRKDVIMSKVLTVGWGVMAILVALTAGLVENLIELVNIIGSLFYGPIVGVFILAFFIKFVQAQAAFFAAIIAQSAILGLHLYSVLGSFELSYLFYNILGPAIAIIVGIIVQLFISGPSTKKPSQ